MPAERPDRLGARRPLEYRSGDSPIHRLGPWPKLALALAVGALALLQQDLRALVLLLALVMVGYPLAGLGAGDLWRDLRWLLLQGALVAGLTVLVRGGDGLAPGSRTALQLVLVFLPMALVVRTTGMDAVLDGLARWLPERAGFALGATVRFAPFFARELGELVEMQRLRGARLAARELWHPSAWRDWLACVAVPMTLRAIEVAEEAADAAAIRGVGSAEPPRGRST
jgi:energy-coupling factor transporter transmembrane protein EcfT